MRTHKLKVIIPEDHELVVKFPREVPAGPAELIVLVESGTALEESPLRLPEEHRPSLAELETRLAADPRPFQDLSLQERRARLRQVMGSGRGFLSSSAEFLENKQREIDLEDKRFAR